ncbi:MAG TPA: hypothetical protein VGM37_19805 [Armatimonadota bacterium]|jgi:hypothetical protein
MNLKGISAGIALLVAALPPLHAAPVTTRMSCGQSPAGWGQPSGQNGVDESVCISSNGRYVAFVTGAGNVFDDTSSWGGFSTQADLPVIAVRDTQTGVITPVTMSLTGGSPNGPSYAPTVTPDGRYVCFCSWASNLIPNDENGQGDVFVRDLQTNVTTRVNGTYDGTLDTYNEAYCLTHSMTDDGRYVVFTSASTHIVAGVNKTDNVYMRDVVTGKTYLVSASSAGVPGNDSSFDPTIASDGRYVSFVSMATNLVSGVSASSPRVYLRDTAAATAATTLVGDGWLPVVKGSGRYVTYTSIPPADGFAQAYRYDAQTGIKTLCSVAPDGSTAGNRDSMGAAVSDDGRYVCFVSKARNLVSGDSNDESDVFVRDLGASPAVTRRVSVATDGLQGNRDSGNADMSTNGAFVAFASASEDLVTTDMNDASDVFLRGPLFTSSGTLANAIRAAGIAGGWMPAGSSDVTKLDVVQSGASAGRVDLADVVKLVRIAAGLG